MAEFFFFVAALGALAGAFGVVFYYENPFYTVLSLVAHLLSLAALFLLLRAEFVAATQVIVYAGAVMVLYVFVVAYIGRAEPIGTPLGPRLRGITYLAVGGVLIELCIALLGTGLKALETEGAPYEAGFGSPAAIGEALLTKFLLPFELASILLTIAAVGAVVLARRRGGIQPDDGIETYSAMDVLRPSSSGTMREAVGTGVAEEEGTTRPEIAAGAGERREEGGW
jgi:NADH-quinone oxidoreductase subunit J